MKEFYPFLALLLCLALLPVSSQAQSDITAMEYFINTDPGYGNGTSISVNSGGNVFVSVSLNTSGLSEGFHTLFVRARNSDNEWSLPEARPFYITASSSTSESDELIAMEYFFNEDPGTGNGTALSITQGTEIELETALATASLDQGFHTLFVRAQNEIGSWGLPEARPFYITSGGSAVEPDDLIAMEYFFNEDPGTGNATALSITQGTEIELETALETASLDQGFHTLFVRAQNEIGSWGLPEARPFYITQSGSAVEPEPLVALEYFIGDDPGFGQGTSIEIDPAVEIDIDAIIATSGLSVGSYTLSVRAQNHSGVWGLYESEVFAISDDFPDPITLVSPTNNATDVSTSPSFVWEEAVDTDSYRFQLALDSEFSELVADTAGIGLAARSTDSPNARVSSHSTTGDLDEPATANSRNGGNSAEGNNSERQRATASTESAGLMNLQDGNITFELEEALETETVYYWRVRGINELGEGEWSAAWSFTTGEEMEESRMVTFQVDMSVQQAAGVYQPESGDLVYVRGSFNDFSLDNPLSEEGGLYIVATELFGEAGSTLEFKYYIAAGDERDLPNDGWEGDVGPGENGNRVIELAEDDQLLDPVFFNNEEPLGLPGTFALLTPEDGTELQGDVDDTTPVMITWEPSANAETYTWLLIEEDGFFDEPLISLISDNEGTSEMLELTVGAIYSALNDAGLDTSMMQSLLWTVEATNDDGARLANEAFGLMTAPATSTGNEPDVPLDFTLAQNYPNPFNPTTQIEYALPEPAEVRLEVFNMMGQRVASVVNGQQNAGYHTATFDGTRLASGMYIYRLTAGSFVETRKMMLVK
ncbi:MAG: T9SS type A sorting domain-containing protein [Balneolales bacterium]|nr:T9SS type A sorting domain-containing protein [Balneolales bacterium]